MIAAQQRVILFGLIGAYTALVAGCASYPSQIAPGMSEDQVVAKFGKPAVTRAYGPGEVLLYPTGPAGQFTYAAETDGSGHVVSVDQVLTIENFARIETGVWTKQRVLDLFGPPAEKVQFRGYPDVWNYRYKESGAWNSLMSVMFDADGVVARTENGPDPMYDKGDSHTAR